MSAGDAMRILHFVTGGFSGATQVAIELVRAAHAKAPGSAMLALRRKRHTERARVEALRAEGLPVELVAGWSHLATVLSLARIARRWRPDVLVAHGFSDHLWGRFAGLLAGVPRLAHVEHNSRERYTAWRRWQTRWLARRTALIVGVSEGVRQSLLALGMPAARTIAIPNGTRLERFADAPAHPYADRTPGIVMAARFASQKDHATLLRALALLRERGPRPPLLLAGGGSARHERRARELCTSLGLDDQVQFLGHRPDLPELLLGHPLAVLSSHYEGMPLSLVEAMAAGCAVVGSAVPGIREMLVDGEDGRLVPHADPAALADVLETLLADPAAAGEMARRGRARALTEFTMARMLARYEQAFAALPDRAGLRASPQAAAGR